MDFINKLTQSEKSMPGTASGGNSVARPHDTDTTTGSSGGGGFMGTINNALGGGQSGEKNEDAVDKGIDWVQEHIFKQGAQNNESAIEQAKDEQISDAIRGAFKSTTGRDVPIKDTS